MEEKKAPSPTPLSANEKLTASILERLVAEGFLQADKVEEAKAKLASGAMKSEDWSLYVDLALGEKEGGKKNA